MRKKYTVAYQRGINDTTFLWFTGYGQQAGNESVASYTFLADHGVRLLRLPISWERIQPTLGGALDTDEVARLDAEISRAHAVGISIIIDLHNYARYQSGGTTLVFSRGITSSQFSDVWTRLANQYKTTPGVLGYDLMNEPHNLISDTGSDTQDDAAIWEQFSQAAVDAIRAVGDTHTLFVEGVGWSGVEAFAPLHPTAWIADSENDTVYSAHQYFEQTGSYVVGSSSVPDFRYSTWANEYNNGTLSWANSPGVNFAQWNLDKLHSFTSWLSSNGVVGHIGEVGWPSAQEMVSSQGLSATEAAIESASWNALGETWFNHADASGLHVTVYSASGVHTDSYPSSPPGLPDRNGVFVHGAGNGELRDANGNLILTPDGKVQPNDIDTAYSQFIVLVNHPSED